jgi:hypothetical protein
MGVGADQPSGAKTTVASTCAVVRSPGAALAVGNHGLTFLAGGRERKLIKGSSMHEKVATVQYLPVTPVIFWNQTIQLWSLAPSRPTARARSVKVGRA